MLYKITILSVLVFFLTSKVLSAQSNLEILNSYILLELDTTNQNLVISSIDSNILDSLPFSVKVVALFSDTSKIDSVHIRVGRTAGGYDVSSISFSYNNGVLPIGVSNIEYKEKGFCICISTSSYNSYSLYLEIWANDKIGNVIPTYSTKVN